MRLLGNLLIGISLFGLLALCAAVLYPEQEGVSPTTSGVVPLHLPWPVVRTDNAAQHVNASVAANEITEAYVGEHPITHIAIDSIGLDADVVEANLVTVDSGLTWQVPAFKVGHAEGTAAAGEVGNAVLLGHVTSLRSGNVFQDLDQVRIGDTVDVFSDSDRFEYTVVSSDAVARTDSSVLQPTETRSISLITCTGIWLPTIWDYTERLVVHAELAQ
jgi:sortase A